MVRGFWFRRIAHWIVLGSLLLLQAPALGQSPRPAPGVAPTAWVAAPVRPRPPRQLAVHLAVTSGVFSYAQIGAEGQGFWSDSSLILSGDLHLAWSRPGQEYSIGLSLSGFSNLGPHWGYEATRVMGGQAGFLIRAQQGFFASSGMGMAHSTSLQGKSSTLPMPIVFLTLGYDLPLSAHFALRFQLNGASLFVVNYGAASVGIVTRF